LAENETLVKVLFYDIVQQMRIPAGISAVNANNCYNWIAHPMASLLFQSLSVPKDACVSIFRTIQDMIFFLHTGFGDSKDFASATGDIKHKVCVKATAQLWQGGG
jgi:hypothetical protein